MEKKKLRYTDYLRSEKWFQLRNELFLLREKKCERCGSTENIQVHHKNYDNIMREKPEDLEILCNKCHKQAHKEINAIKSEIASIIENSQLPLTWICAGCGEYTDEFNVCSCYRRGEDEEIKET